MDEPHPEFMTPEDVTAADLGSRLRGADPALVTAHLRRVAETVAGLHEANAALREERELLEVRLDDATRAALAELDDDVLEERLGAEARQLVTEAREQTTTIIAAAEAEAADIVAQAEKLHAERSHLADVEAGRIRAEMVSARDEHVREIETELAAARAQADAELATLREAHENERQAAEAEAARLIAEAQGIRRRILEDLARRRTAARRQIEQLRAGRDRLLASHDALRRALDEVGDELRVSMSEARAAAETAGHSIPASTIEELEAEIETARLTGLLDTGPVPIVEPPSAAEADDRPPGDATDSAPRPTDGVEAEPVADGASDDPEPIDLPTPDPIEEREPGTDAPTAEAPLAAVVDLESARLDAVDTGSHPASRSKAARPSPETAADLDPRVEDLFARMRSSRGEESPSPESADEAAATTNGVRVSEPSVEPPSLEELEPAINTMSRQLKRLLADEQSEVLSTIRTGGSAPGLDDLLGDTETHQDRYWEVARHSAIDAAGGSTAVDIDTVRPEIDAMVVALRGRVEHAVGNAADNDAMVEDLRNVYRDVKTRRIVEHAEAVCAAAADLAARGKDRAGER